MYTSMKGFIHPGDSLYVLITQSSWPCCGTNPRKIHTKGMRSMGSISYCKAALVMSQFSTCPHCSQGIKDMEASKEDLSDIQYLNSKSMCCDRNTLTRSLGKEMVWLRLLRKFWRSWKSSSHLTVLINIFFYIEGTQTVKKTFLI